MDIDVIQMITIKYIAKTHGTFHVRAFVFSKKYVHLMCVVQSAHIAIANTDRLSLNSINDIISK